MTIPRRPNRNPHTADDAPTAPEPIAVAAADDGG
jgi:hypothetical protein